MHYLAQAWHGGMSRWTRLMKPKNHHSKCSKSWCKVMLHIEAFSNCVHNFFESCDTAIRRRKVLWRKGHSKVGLLTFLGGNPDYWKWVSSVGWVFIILTWFASVFNPAVKGNVNKIISMGQATCVRHGPRRSFCPGAWYGWYSSVGLLWGEEIRSWVKDMPGICFIPVWNWTGADSIIFPPG
jgi:hypothetical protein